MYYVLYYVLYYVCYLLIRELRGPRLFPVYPNPLYPEQGLQQKKT